MFVVVALVAAALSVQFTWPSKYKLTGEFQVLEANVTLPIIVNWNEDTKQENLMYFNSTMEYTIWDGTNTSYYYVHVKKDKQECASIGSAVLIPDRISFLPDLTNYSDKGITNVRGIKVRKYEWEDIEGDQNTSYHRTNIYTMYVDASTNAPVRFDMKGYNIILGSHFDQYRIEYLTFEEDVNDRTAYAVPSICSARNLSEEELKGKAYHDRYGTIINSMMTPRKSFNDFAAKYGKTYATQEEAEYRYRVYQDNLRTIASINTDATRTWTAAPNKFADMTREEIRDLLFGIRGKRNAEPDFYLSSNREGANVSLPTAIDWRVHPAVSGRVKDQCACGSCWSFGATGALEGRYAIKKGLTDHVNFSEQFIIDCFWDLNDHGCNGGNSENVFNWAAKELDGFTTEDDIHYLGINSYCNTKYINKDYKVSGWAMVAEKDTMALKQALVDGPVAVAIAVPDSMVWYADGIYNDPECGSNFTDLVHAVTAEGYGYDEITGTEYWIVKNSWSTWWGKDGYIYINTKDNLCGVATDASYPIFD